jgi:hypothetical protein
MVAVFARSDAWPIVVGLGRSASFGGTLYAQQTQKEMLGDSLVSAARQSVGQSTRAPGPNCKSSDALPETSRRPERLGIARASFPTLNPTGTRAHA